MKLIIAGSRRFKKQETVKLIYSIFDFFGIESVDEIVCGMAGGVDSSGKKFAENENIFVKPFPADWETHGKAAGPIRNREMANYADALLLIWNGKSKGSASMKKEMQKLNKPIYEVIVNNDN